MSEALRRSRCHVCAGNGTVYRRVGWDSAVVDCPHCSGAGSVEGLEPSDRQLREEIAEGLDRLHPEITIPRRSGID